MGNADGYLNKKSWHPGSKKNLERVWLAEEDAKERRRAEVERARVVCEERAWERERDLACDEAAKRRGGVAWMYQQSLPSSSAEPKPAEGRQEPGVKRRRSSSQARDDPAREEARLNKMLEGIRSGIASSSSGVEAGGGSYGYVAVGCGDEEDEEDAFRIARLPEAVRSRELKRIQRQRKKRARRAKEEARRAKVREAERVLKQAHVVAKDALPVGVAHDPINQT